MTRVFPCYGCTERHEGCHAECEKYKEADRLNKEDNALLHHEHVKEANLIGHCAEQAWKRNKRNNGKWRTL